MCENEGAKVTVCHSKTQDIPDQTKMADIVIVAIGKPNLIDEKYFSKGQVVVDVGITRVGEGLVGDVNFEKVKDKVSYITPVPGGVGQMTVLALFENLVDSCYNAGL
jgi:methylenetetrahydrofolate dehydrogenase (NADP+)/methenyltetrahydrofolate cyclohydrolase